MPIISVFSSAIVGLLASAHLASAHTWIEQLMVISPNGTLVGQPGFPRGNVLRGTPGFSDPAMVNLIPPDGRTINQIESSDLMCKSTQTSQTQTNDSPRLQAAPGAAVALRFQENGHVTLPDNQPGKPSNRGTVYVYGTTQPSPDDSFLAIHRVWNSDGTGGDGRGVLLSTRNFDDGQCYQTNGGQISVQRQQQFPHSFNNVMGNDLWCQQDIQIPSNAPSGQPYTLYWVWDWPTMPGTAGFPEGKQEIYTTCMDVDIVDDTGIDPVSKVQVSFSQGQDVSNAAIADQLADISNPTAVTGQTIPFTSTDVSPSFPSSTAPSTTITPSLTTSFIGSTIGFSASATGPVVGGASEASISAATASETGVPGFLTVHTGSTTGPGVETQTFTVLPIGVPTDDAQQQPQQTDAFGQGNGRGGRGGNNNGTNAEPNPQFYHFVKMLMRLSARDTDPQVTPANVANNVAVDTFTEYESVTETVYQTVFSTRYTKRDSKFDTFPPSASTDAYDTRAFRSGCWFSPAGTQLLSFSRPTRPPSWRSHDGISKSFGSARPSGWAPPSGSNAGHGDNDCNPFWHQNFSQPFSTAGWTTLPTNRPKAKATTMAISLSAPNHTPAPFPPLSPDPASTYVPEPFPPLPITTGTTPNTFLQTMHQSAPLSAALSTQELTLPPLTDTPPAPTPAPSINPRAAEPASADCSTDHALFKLRARNPFIWLGWMSSAKSATPTST